MGVFSLDPGLAIWTWISFLALFALLTRYVFPKLLLSLRERENLVARSVDEARAIREQLAASEEAHQRILRQARAEGDRVIREARAEAEALRKRLAAQAESEAKTIVDLARQRVEEERAASVQALAEELADFVCHASEKVIGESFTGDTERAWALELARGL